MPNKTTKEIAEDFLKLKPTEQEVAMRYLENKLLGKTKENAEIKQMLGMIDKTPKESKD